MMEAEQGFFAPPEEGDAGARFASEMRRVSVELQEADRAARGLSAAVGGGLRKALDAAVFGTGRFSDVLRGMARDVARGALGAAVGPVQAAVGLGVGGLVSGAVSALTGGVRAFARGGVVDGATVFPTGGGVGVMGEAGPEAVMPLARDSSGKLGVRSQGGGGGGGTQIVINDHTTIHVDARSDRAQALGEISQLIDNRQAQLVDRLRREGAIA